MLGGCMTEVALHDCNPSVAREGLGEGESRRPIGYGYIWPDNDLEKVYQKTIYSILPLFFF